jgi:hypothetical protein
LSLLYESGDIPEVVQKRDFSSLPQGPSEKVNTLVESVKELPAAVGIFADGFFRNVTPGFGWHDTGPDRDNLTKLALRISHKVGIESRDRTRKMTLNQVLLKAEDIYKRNPEEVVEGGTNRYSPLGGVGDLRLVPLKGGKGLTYRVEIKGDQNEDWIRTDSTLSLLDIMRSIPSEEMSKPSSDGFERLAIPGQTEDMAAKAEETRREALESGIYIMPGDPALTYPPVKDPISTDLPLP